MALFVPTSARYVESITIVNAGSGYTSAPTLSISGGGGTGATATCEIFNGEIFSVTVTDPGDGYTSSPTVTASGGGGANAEFTAILGYASKASQYPDYDLAYRIKNQLPEFFVKEYPKFIEFMEKYYEFMDNDYERLLNPDIEFDKGRYIDEWINTLGLTFPKNSVSDKKLLYSYINDIYESKGSIKSIQAFFRFAYNINIEVEYPSEKILKASDGIWVEEQAAKVQVNTFTNAITGLTEEYNLFDLGGKALQLKYFENVGDVKLSRFISAASQRVTQIAYTFPSSHTIVLDFDIPRTSIPGPGAGAELNLITSGGVSTFTTSSADASRSSAGSPYAITASDYTVSSDYGRIEAIDNGATDANRTAGTYKINSHAFSNATQSLTISGATATATFAVTHGIKDNQIVEITGATPSAFDGIYKVTNVTSTTFDYTPATTPAGNATIQPTVVKTKDFVTNSPHGTGAEFTVVVVPSGAASVTIDEGGDLYQANETITINDRKLGGGGAAKLALTIGRVTRSSEATFSVAVDGSGDATVTVSSAGKGFTPGDVITIPDSNLGSGGAENLTLTVLTLDNGFIDEIVVVDGGLGYLAAPDIVLVDRANSSTASGAEATVKVSDNKISSVVINEIAQGTTSSIGIAGTTATATLNVAHSLTNGDAVIISGASPSEYNGTYVVSNVTSTTFDYTPDTTPSGNAVGQAGVNKTNRGTNYNSNEVVAELDLLPIRTQVIYNDTTYGFLTRTLVSIGQGTYSGSATDAGFRVGQIYDLSETGISSGYAVPPTPVAQDHFDNITFSEITTSLTISGATATATFTGNHALNNGDTVVISGAVPTEYNGTHTIANASGNTFDFTPSSTPSGDATVQGFAVKSSGTDDGAGYFGQPYVFVGGSRNARVRVASVSSSGVPLTWEIVGAGSDFINQETTLTLTSPSGEDITVLITTGYLFNYDGFWRDDRGKVSDVNNLFDNDRYQNYSYVVKGPIQSTEWLPTFLPLMHPAGMKVFGDFIIEHEISVLDNYGVAVDEIGIFEFFVDNATATDNIESIDVTKVLSDSTAVTEDSDFAFTKVLTDSSTATESLVSHFTKVLGDSVTVTDTVNRDSDIVVTYVRDGATDSEFADTVTISDTDFLIGKLIDFADSITASEAAEILTSAPESDSTTTSDVNVLGVTKVINDNISSSDAINSINTEKDLTDTASATENTVIQVDFTKSDSATTSDSGAVLNQDYAEPGFFGDIYTGTGAIF